VDVDFQVEAGAEDILAQETRGARFRQSLLQDQRPLRELAADVNVSQVRVDRETGDNHPLDQLVRILVDDVAVLERPRLRFVGVADQVNRLWAVLFDEAPLDAAGEAGAAASAQTAGFHLIDDVRLGHGQRLFQLGVAAFVQVAIDVRRPALAVDIREHHATLAQVRDTGRDGRGRRHQEMLVALMVSYFSTRPAAASRLTLS
jgi:hypothetical protein